MILENSFLRVEIAEAGAELMSIYDKSAETELLWWGDGKYWKRRSPVLFPNVGKTYNNEMLIEGKVYATAQHGFARDRVFTLEESDESHAVYLLTYDEETLARYPYRFELRIGYAIENKNLTVTWNVKNADNREIAFTIGGHPAFCFASAEDKKEDYMLRFPGKDSLRYTLLDVKSGTAAPDRQCDLSLDNNCLPLTEELFANDALILDDYQIEEAWLCTKDGKPRIGMESKGFPNYGIWSVKDAPFVCLEPWAGRCDNVGFCSEISEKPNINRVAAGESFEKSYRLMLP